MLVEPKLAVRTQHAAKLQQRLALVGYRAEHPRDDYDIDGLLDETKRRRGASDHADAHGRATSGSLGLAAEVGLWLNRNQLVDAGGIVLEVDAVACADLNDAPGRFSEELTAQLALATSAVPPAEAVKETGEEWILDGLAHGLCTRYPLDSAGLMRQYG